jgi:hypothetical protein
VLEWQHSDRATRYIHPPHSDDWIAAPRRATCASAPTPAESITRLLAPVLRPAVWNVCAVGRHPPADAVRLPPAEPPRPPPPSRRDTERRLGAGRRRATSARERHPRGLHAGTRRERGVEVLGDATPRELVPCRQWRAAIRVDEGDQQREETTDQQQRHPEGVAKVGGGEDHVLGSIGPPPACDSISVGADGAAPCPRLLPGEHMCLTCLIWFRPGVPPPWRAPARPYARSCVRRATAAAVWVKLEAVL